MYDRFKGAVRQYVGDAPQITRQLLLVGEDNPQSSAEEHALYPYPVNCAGERLCNRIFAMPRTGHYLSIWRTNLCNTRWTDKQAGKRAWELLSQDAPWTKLVLLGRKVAKVYEPICNISLEPFAIGRIDTGHRVFTVVSLPHPSGRCREWNDPNSFERARDVMRTIAPDIAWGAS
jgi:hypothetical protein